MPPVISHSPSLMRRRAPAPVHSATLSVGELIAIAITTSVLTLVILLPLISFLVRRRGHLGKTVSKVAHAAVHGGGYKQLLSINTANIRKLPGLNSSSSDLCTDESGNYTQWSAVEAGRHLPTARANTWELPSSNRLTQLHYISRASWPADSSTKLQRTLPPLTQAQTTPGTMLHQLPPPSYDSQSAPGLPNEVHLNRLHDMADGETCTLPPRSTSQASMTGSLLSQIPISRRVSSEISQLASILRSTSLRLKSPRQEDSSRVLTNLSQLPGLPPTKPLPRLPKKGIRYQCHATLGVEDSVSVCSSISQEVVIPTPSLTKKASSLLSCGLPPRHRAIGPLSGLNHSVCHVEKSDLATPALLITHTKNTPAGAYRRRELSHYAARDMSTMFYEDDPASGTVTVQNETISKAEPTAIAPLSSVNNLCTSSRETPTLSVSSTQIAETQPHAAHDYYIQEATPKLPSSLLCPLRDISGNAESPWKHTLPAPSFTPNSFGPSPFHWSRQKAIQPRSRFSGTKPKHHLEREKRHKRSKIVRISYIPRPSSALEVSDDNGLSTLQSHHDLNASQVLNRLSEPLSSRRFASVQYPSSRTLSMAYFNPSVSVPDHVTAKSSIDSPTLPAESFSLVAPLSNTYPRTSVEEDGLLMNSTDGQSRHQAYILSGMIPNPTFSIPQPPLATSTKLSPETEDSLQKDVTPSVTYPPVSACTSSRITSQINNRTLESLSGKLAHRPANGQRESLVMSIRALRRMNSDISSSSSLTSEHAGYRDNSPLHDNPSHIRSSALPQRTHKMDSDIQPEPGNHRFIGLKPSSPRRRVEKRDSAAVRTIREKRRQERQKTPQSALVGADESKLIPGDGLEAAIHQILTPSLASVSSTVDMLREAKPVAQTDTTSPWQR